MEKLSVLWPRRDGDLSRFVGWLTPTHTQRWYAHHHTVGTGHLYQVRFKSFPVQNDEHFLTVCRYVERNALRANLVQRTEDWPWSSLWHRSQRTEFSQSVLSDWHVPCPRQWVHQVNQPQTEAEVAALRRSVHRGTPFGDSDWTKRIVKRLGLEVTPAHAAAPRSDQTPTTVPDLVLRAFAAACAFRPP